MRASLLAFVDLNECMEYNNYICILMEWRSFLHYEETNCN